jgi:phenylacetic acid degradation operon negative regulatory protein
LEWLGFGNVTSGVWVAPSNVGDELQAMLTRLGLSQYAQLFRGEHLGFASQPDLVRQAWDLESLALRYDEFTAMARPLLRRWRSARRLDDHEAFVDYVCVLTSWRPLPFLDPGLPEEALPSRWPGMDAWTIFGELVERLQPSALRYVERICGKPASGNLPRPASSARSCLPDL